jgi:hypothetical protein
MVSIKDGRAVPLNEKHHLFAFTPIPISKIIKDSL